MTWWMWLIVAAIGPPVAVVAVGMILMLWVSAWSLIEAVFDL